MNRASKQEATTTMGVLADWQVEAEKIIEPFTNSQKVEGIITHGVSSYGYDLRASQEFEVFTAANETGGYIDPKNFNPKFLEKVQGNVIIPPNAFALTRSIEKLSIPRDVVAIVLGKSTYARCFAGDTRVALVDGTSISFSDMVSRHAAGEMFWGYSVGPLGRIIVTLLDSPRLVGVDRLVEVAIDRGEPIRCTSDHLFLTREGEFKAAGDLKAGDSLMPLYRALVRGYESVFQPLTGHMNATHRLADEWNVRNGVYPDVAGTHRHHKDFVRGNNNPWNLERMEASEHIRLHNDESYGVDFDPDEHSQSIKEALSRLAENDEWRANQTRVQSERAKAFWHSDEYAVQRAELIAKRLAMSDDVRAKMSESQKRRFASDEARVLHGELMRKVWSGDIERRANQSALLSRLKTRHQLTDDIVLKALHETGSIRGAARLLGCDRSVFRNYHKAVLEFRGQTTNHKVVSVRELPGEHEVYCLTVPEAGNFALESGVFVKNCGLVVNCTPLEPEWRGHVTLELSNTTPKPAIVYAGEGIAQVLFLRADGLTQVLLNHVLDRMTEEAFRDGRAEPREYAEKQLQKLLTASLCKTSYADKGGRYQDQKDGVVMPCVRGQTPLHPSGEAGTGVTATQVGLQ